MVSPSVQGDNPLTEVDFIVTYYYICTRPSNVMTLCLCNLPS